MTIVTEDCFGGAGVEQVKAMTPGGLIAGKSKHQPDMVRVSETEAFACEWPPAVEARQGFGRRGILPSANPDGLWEGPLPKGPPKIVTTLPATSPIGHCLASHHSMNSPI